MRTTKKRSLVLLPAIATMVLGLVAMPAAHGDSATLTVTPSIGLGDPQDVTIRVDHFVADSFASLQVAECGNAYANLDALPSRPTVVPGVLDAKDCMAIGFLSQGTLLSPPVDVAGLTDPDPTVRQTGIGTGNRSCIASPPALSACFVYVSTSVNLNFSFPQTDISFANPSPASSDPAATTITLTPIGSPVALGKHAHALVQVTTANPLSKPDGTVEVFDGATPLGSADLDANASASVDLGTLTGDLTDLTATYVGNGSFAGSASTTPASLSTTQPDNISIGDASIVEGDSHSVRNMMFPVVLSQPTQTKPVLVNYTLVPTGDTPATIGAAKTADTEVLALSKPGTKTLTFKPGPATVKYITVKTYGDTNPDGDKTFGVQLSNNGLNTSDYVIRRGMGNGLIIDDDNPTSAVPALSIGNPSVPEGDFGGAHALKFPVTMSSTSSTDVTVMVQVTNGTAVQGSKLTREWSGAVNRKLVFKAGQVTKLVSVATYPNLLSGLDKTVHLKILSATPLDPNVSVSFDPNAIAVGTILSDE